MHELLRQYEQEKLVRSPDGGRAVRDRHCAYFCSMMERWGEQVKSAQQRAALSEMDAEMANALAAWGWAGERRQSERLAQAALGLYALDDYAGRVAEIDAAARAGVDALSTVVAPGALRSRGRLLVGLAISLNRQRRGPGLSLLHESLSLLERAESAGEEVRSERVIVLRHIAHELKYSDPDEATRLWERALALCQEIDELESVATIRRELARMAYLRGDYTAAEASFLENLEIERGLGTVVGLAHVKMQRSMLAWHRG
jgi:hypothetical protein